MYIGSGMSCHAEPYYIDSIHVAALSYADKDRWPCDTSLTVVGAVGSIVVRVTDTCGGCTNQIDLSEAGQIAVCGSLGDNCAVKVTKNED